jgi:hypothetical protein
MTKSRNAKDKSPWPGGVVLAVAGGAGCLLLFCVVVGAGAWIGWKVWGGSNQSSAPRDVGDVFAFVEKEARQGRIEYKEKGIVLDLKKRFGDSLPEGALLIGVEAGIEDFGGDPKVESLRPIFRTANGEKLGVWHGKPPATPLVVKAKPGYVVGGFTVRTTGFLTGMSVKFVRLDGNRLQWNDTYTSDWIGSRSGREETVQAEGYVIGICGHLGIGNDMVGLGTMSVVP